MSSELLTNEARILLAELSPPGDRNRLIPNRLELKRRLVAIEAEARNMNPIQEPATGTQPAAGGGPPTPAVRLLRDLEKAATPAPWGDDYGVRSIVGEIAGGSVLVGNTIDAEDAALIAAMRNALPLLLDVVEAARQYRKSRQLFGPPGQSLDAALAKLDAAQ